MNFWLEELGERSLPFPEKEKTEGGTDGQGSELVDLFWPCFLEAHIRHSGGDIGLAIGFSPL